MFDWMIVGAGFAGSVLAERLASQRNEKILVIDKRDHIAGNAYDVKDAAGILVHQYGPHIFYTNADSMLEYLSQQDPQDEVQPLSLRKCQLQPKPN